MAHSHSRIDWERIYGRLDSIEAMLEASVQESAEHDAEVLAERALLLARESTNGFDETMSDRMLVLAFQVGDLRVGVEVKDIQEIVSLSQIVKVPCVPRYIAGVTNVRGNIVTLIELRRLFGDSSEGIVDLKRAILIANHDSRVGILSEEIIGTSQIARSSLQKISGGREGDRFVRGLTSDFISILDSHAILTDPRVNIDDAS